LQASDYPLPFFLFSRVESNHLFMAALRAPVIPPVTLDSGKCPTLYTLSGSAPTSRPQASFRFSIRVFAVIFSRFPWLRDSHFSEVNIAHGYLSSLFAGQTRCLRSFPLWVSGALRLRAFQIGLPDSQGLFAFFRSTTFYRVFWPGLWFRPVFLASRLNTIFTSARRHSKKTAFRARRSAWPSRISIGSPPPPFLLDDVFSWERWDS